VFTTDVTGSDTYTYGVLTWTTGLNDGRSMEVKLHSSAVMTLQLAMPYAVQVGDEFTVTPGCDKTEATCKTTYSNLVRFRGFPDVPGTDAMLRGGQ